MHSCFPEISSLTRIFILYYLYVYFPSMLEIFLFSFYCWFLLLFPLWWGKHLVWFQLRFVPWLREWSVFVHISCHLIRMHILPLLLWVVYECGLDPLGQWLVEFFHSVSDFLSSHSINSQEMGVKSPTTVPVDLSVSPFNSIGSCFPNFAALLFSEHTHT